MTERTNWADADAIAIGYGGIWVMNAPTHRGVQAAQADESAATLAESASEDGEKPWFRRHMPLVDIIACLGMRFWPTGLPLPVESQAKPPHQCPQARKSGESRHGNRRSSGCA